MYGSAAAPSARRMASGTSSSVSKQQAPMDGPVAASRSPGSVPKASCIRRTVLAARPLATPRHPAWTAPMASCTGSYSRIVPQSAENTTSGMCFSRQIMASTLV